MDGRADSDGVKPAEMPEMLADVLRQGGDGAHSTHLYKNAVTRGDFKAADFKRLQVTSSDFKDVFTDGRRDNDLFHTANTMIKGGADPVFARQVLEKITNSWGEDSSDREIKKWLGCKSRLLEKIVKFKKNAGHSDRFMLGENRDL